MENTVNSEAVVSDLEPCTALGIDLFLDNYVGLQAHDQVIIATHQRCRATAKGIAAGVKVRGATVTSITFGDLCTGDEFSQALTRGADGLSPMQPLRVIVCEYDTMSFRQALKDFQARLGDRVAIYRLINCTTELFDLCFQVEWEQLRAFNSHILNRIYKSRWARMTSANGTDMMVEFDHKRYRWVSNFGKPASGELTVLPAGEVNTFPASVNGHLVANGAFNLNRRFDGDVRLNRAPVHLDVVDGRLQGFSCSNGIIDMLFRTVFSEANACRVGEFGIGTNIGVDRFVAFNSHINERHPGVHIGFGEHGQPGVVAYAAVNHLDLIVSDVVIELDDGSTIDPLRPALGDDPHPVNTHSEDTA